MKAWVLHEIGDIRWEEVEQPVPGEQEVLLRVRAAYLYKRHLFVSADSRT